MEFQYDYVKPKYDGKAKLCYMNTDSCIVYIKTDDICKDITEDVETSFYTSIFHKKNNKLILKMQQRFKSKRHNVFTKEINKNALSSNDDKRMQSIDDKRMQSIDSTETYAFGISKDLVSEKERLNVTKYNKTI